MRSPKIHRTPLYRAMAAYRNMRFRCLNANGKNPAYLNVELKMSQDEFLEWAIPKYEKFIKDNPNISPSISRFNDEGHYEIGNIEIISFKKNNSMRKGKSLLRSDGTKPCSKCRVIKDSSEFSKNRTKSDGLANECRMCKSIRMKQYLPRKRELRRLKKLNDEP